MEKLYLQFEQLRDIATSRSTYDNDDSWEDNLLAQLAIVDEQMEIVFASAIDTDLLNDELP